MSAFLLTWKPQSENKKYGWPLKDLQELVSKVERSGAAVEPWRLVNRRESKIGDRVFLIQQGKRGLALLGWGRIIASPITREAHQFRLKDWSTRTRSSWHKQPNSG